MAKLLFAKVKDDSRLATVTAFGGQTFTKYAWLQVNKPGGEAETHPFLDFEVRETSDSGEIDEGQGESLEAASSAYDQESEDVENANQDQDDQGDQEDEVFATGAALRLADESGIDLSGVEGSGADGKILKGDVKAALGD